MKWYEWKNTKRKGFDWKILPDRCVQCGKPCDRTNAKTVYGLWICFDCVKKLGKQLTERRDLGGIQYGR